MKMALLRHDIAPPLPQAIILLQNIAKMLTKTPRRSISVRKQANDLASRPAEMLNKTREICTYRRSRRHASTGAYRHRLFWSQSFMTMDNESREIVSTGHVSQSFHQGAGGDEGRGNKAGLRMQRLKELDGGQ